MREVKVCLFLPELLWVALRRRAAAQGVSALHLVRLALEGFAPGWREASLVSPLASAGDAKRKARDFPGRLLKETKYSRRSKARSERPAEGSSLLLEGWDTGELAAEASRGIRDVSRGRFLVWGRRAAVLELRRRLKERIEKGQPSLFSADELVG